MSWEHFRAVADVFVVPKPNSAKFHQRDWPKKPIFNCIIAVDPSEGQTSILRVKMENRKDHSLIAVAPYDGQHGIISVSDSARHFVLVIRTPSMEAWLGIGFRDPSDSIDFSLAIQSFMRRRMFENRLSSPGLMARKAANPLPKKDLPTVPFITPPPTDSATFSEEEFREFH